jgi:hypothetical protein
MVGRLFGAAAGAALLLMQAEVGQATVIQSPTGATASSTFSEDYDIGNTIDQSGLSVTFISGTSDFDAYLASNPIHDPIAIDQEW